MNIHRALGAMTVLALCAAPAFADTPTTRPSSLFIAPFRNDKPAAVSLTFDDGSVNQVTIGVPLLEKYHLPASFFVIAGLTREHTSDPVIKEKDNWGETSWEQWREVARKGFEIGNHSLTHVFLTKISPAELEKEVNDSAQLIKKEIGNAPISFVCPFNEMNDQVKKVVFEHHLCLRDQWTEFGGPNYSASQAIASIDENIAKHQWLVPMLHGIDHDGYNPLPDNTLEQIFAYLNERRGDLWIDTFGNISKYTCERAHTTVAVVDQASDAMTFQVTSTLDPATYDVPLTVVIPRWWGKQVQLRLETLEGKTVRASRAVEADRLLVNLPAQTAVYRLVASQASLAGHGATDPKVRHE